MIEDNPLNIENIKEKQDQDAGLQQSATRHPMVQCHKPWYWWEIYPNYGASCQGKTLE